MPEDSQGSLPFFGETVVKALVHGHASTGGIPVVHQLQVVV